MLSTRGEAFAKANLAKGYLSLPKATFDKETKQGVVSFSNAENFLMHDYIRIKALPARDNTSLTYHEGPFGSQRLRTAMAGLLNTYFSPASPIESNHIVFANGVTSLNTMCAQCLTDSDTEGILLGQPIYGSFAGDLTTVSGCQSIYTPFGGADQFSPPAVAHYEKAVLHAREKGITVRALLICNPHNPLGRCYEKEALEAIFQFCQRYQIHLISDEVYALSTYGGHERQFVSALSIDLEPLGVDPALIHVLYGMSKDFAVAGLRLGCLISRNERLLQAMLSISRFHWSPQISCGIATTILEDKGFVHGFLQESQRLLKEHQILATRALEDAKIPYAKGCTAGFFLWIDLSRCLDDRSTTSEGGWAAEEELSRRLSQIGVEMSSGRAYRNETPGWYRILFSVDRESLKEGLSRIINFYHSEHERRA
ncbi:acc synthase [Aspergillus desertorum]